MAFQTPRFLFVIMVASFCLLGCQDDEVVLTQMSNYDLQGYVQKGPFINGTAITVSELSNKLVATGRNFTTQIIDNKGTFSLKDVELQSDYVQLMAEGFYFDEVRGEKSTAQLTLFALADVSDVGSVNVNLLSHLEKDRVIYLMQEEEKNFDDAKHQAQQEVLTIFGIEKADMNASELLDISQDGEDNAILLAISAVMQGQNTVAELSELLANIITDIRGDGVLDSESTQKKIRLNAMSLNLNNVRQHLENRYEELGVNANISNFEEYITVPNPFQTKKRFQANTEHPEAGFRANSKIYIFTDLSNLYEYNPENDSWTKKADFPGYQRENVSCYSLNGKGYIGLGYGLNEFNDFWKYDPVDDAWSKIADFPGPYRTGQISFTANSKAYVGLGSSVTGSSVLRDIWQYDPDTNTWTQKADFPTQYEKRRALAFSFENNAFVFTDYEFSREVWMYNPVSNKWIQNEDAVNTLHNVFSFTVSGKGYTSGDGKIQEYDPVEDKWNPMVGLDTEIVKDIAIGVSTDSKGYLLLQSGEFYEFTPPQD